MANYLGTVLYDDVDDKFYFQVGLPGDTTPGDDVITSGEIAGTALVVGDQTAIADAATISGGEAPTEAEFNALVAKVNAIITALEASGLLTATP